MAATLFDAAASLRELRTHADALPRELAGVALPPGVLESLVKKADALSDLLSRFRVKLAEMKGGELAKGLKKAKLRTARRK